MGRSLLAFLTFSFFFSPKIPYAETGDEVSFLSLQTRIQEVFKSSVSSVVRVKAARERRVGNKVSTSLKMGSGFFISKEGHVLTTGLLQDADRIWIEHRNSFYLAQKVGHDPLCNLSLLKVTEKPKDFTFTSFAETKGDLSVGTILIGVTCALEFKIAPTYGIMQSHEFSFGKRLFPTKMIRSSMPLGMGEIGAPVFDLNGRFVGITYAALPDLRSSFLLPARACLRIRDDLLLSGKVDYGWFGITTVRKANADSGVDIVISDFIEGSPASGSKLKKGDVLRKINGSIVHDSGDLAHASFFSKPGTFAQFTVDRLGKEFMTPVKVGARQTYDFNKLLDMSNSSSGYSSESNATSKSAPKSTDLNKTATP
jgi:S1-C subfamily serine protease